MVLTHQRETIFYKTLPSLITQEDNEILHAFPTVDEIHNVIKDMDSNSSAGPDGFSWHFYKVRWEYISQDLYEAIYEFFAGFELPK